MKCLRIYADEAGESHFSEYAIPMAPARVFADLPPFRISTFARGPGVRLISPPPELNGHDWHTAPERQLAIGLNGAVEYETSDGEVRRLSPGQVALVEDTWGKGHVTRFAGGEQFFLFVPFGEDPGAAR